MESDERPKPKYEPKNVEKYLRTHMGKSVSHLPLTQVLNFGPIILNGWKHLNFATRPSSKGLTMPLRSTGRGQDEAENIGAMRNYLVLKYPPPLPNPSWVKVLLAICFVETNWN